MNKIKVKSTSCEFIQMFLIFIVYGWFFYFSWISYSEFQNEMTGISQFLTPAKDLPLPTITVCSEEIFKNVSEETSREMLLQNLNNHVFALDDLFHKIFLYYIQDWHPHEIFSSHLGVCFSIAPKQNVNGRNHNYYWIALPIGKSYQV